MQTVPSRAGGAIPRLFLFLLALLVCLGTVPVQASRGGDGSQTVARASYYGHQFAGRRTASGAIFRPEELTAAHRSLRLGTRVRVTNLHNGRSVVVTVNDRGPYVRGRQIDLSLGAARELGMLERGVARVRIDIQ